MAGLTAQVQEVIMLETVDCLELTANVKLLSYFEQVLDSRVSLVVAAEDLLGLLDPDWRAPC